MLVFRLFYCVFLINRYVKYRDFSRVIKVYFLFWFFEVFDFGVFGGVGCFVVFIDSFFFELGVIDFIVVRYILVLFDFVVLLRVLVEFFEGVVCVFVVVLVFVGCVVFSVDGIGFFVVVCLVWQFDFGSFDVGVGVYVLLGIVNWNQLKFGFYMIVDDGRIVGCVIVYCVVQ